MSTGYSNRSNQSNRSHLTSLFKRAKSHDLDDAYSYIGESEFDRSMNSRSQRLPASSQSPHHLDSRHGQERHTESHSRSPGSDPTRSTRQPALTRRSPSHHEVPWVVRNRHASSTTNSEATANSIRFSQNLRHRKSDRELEEQRQREEARFTPGPFDPRRENISHHQQRDPLRSLRPMNINPNDGRHHLRGLPAKRLDPQDLSQFDPRDRDIEGWDR